jgi:hypothetical protein
MKEVRVATVRADFSKDLSADNAHILQIGILPRQMFGFCWYRANMIYHKIQISNAKLQNYNSKGFIDCSKFDRI